jgi:hypothetical protein
MSAGNGLDMTIMYSIEAKSTNVILLHCTRYRRPLFLYYMLPIHWLEGHDTFLHVLLHRQLIVNAKYKPSLPACYAGDPSLLWSLRCMLGRVQGCYARGTGCL